MFLIFEIYIELGDQTSFGQAAAQNYPGFLIKASLPDF